MNYFSFKSLTMMFNQNFKKSPDGNEKKNEKKLIFFFGCSAMFTTKTLGQKPNNHCVFFGKLNKIPHFTPWLIISLLRKDLLNKK